MKNLKSVRDLFGVGVGEGRLCSKFYGNIHIQNGRQRGKEYLSLRYSLEILVRLSIYTLSVIGYLAPERLHRFFNVSSFYFVSGIETDELDSNAEEFEDESVEFFVKEEITEVEE